MRRAISRLLESIAVVIALAAIIAAGSAHGPPPGHGGQREELFYRLQLSRNITITPDSGLITVFGLRARFAF